jgi:hypothetical protein
MPQTPPNRSLNFHKVFVRYRFLGSLCQHRKSWLSFSAKHVKKKKLLKHFEHFFNDHEFVGSLLISGKFRFYDTEIISLFENEIISIHLQTIMGCMVPRFLSGLNTTLSGRLRRVVVKLANCCSFSVVESRSTSIYYFLSLYALRFIHIHVAF